MTNFFLVIPILSPSELFIEETRHCTFWYLVTSVVFLSFLTQLDLGLNHSSALELHHLNVWKRGNISYQSIVFIIYCIMILIVMPKKKQISMFLGFVIYITNINQSFDINFQKSANTIVMKKIGQKCWMF